MTINKRLKSIAAAIGATIGFISGLMTIEMYFKEDKPIINNYYYINNQEFTEINNK